MKYLVIVESPSKCKKIEKYLNDNNDLHIYEVVATMGHITSLTSLKNIDFANNFACTYDLIEAKKKNTEAIRKKIKDFDEVMLSCDPDREGEGIAATICQVFGLNVFTTKRVTFNEITETAIVNAMKNPRTIDMNLVHAQQTRQILDLIVGYKVSPMLWKYITKYSQNSLSAGRCQTPALRIIYDNYQEIRDATQSNVYNTIGYFTNLNIPFDLNKQFSCEEDMTDFLDGSADFSHSYSCSEPKKIYKTPPEPFTTSRIQQVASNELHYSPKETMRLCQNLYEAGYITYMRTDSKIYSSEFIDSVHSYVVRNYAEGEKYFNDSFKNANANANANANNDTEPINTKTKTKSKKQQPIIKLTQDAHEAIRPTNISLYDLPDKVDSKEKRMYKLIWENTLESCLNSAVFNAITATITGFNKTVFSYTSEQIVFPGWLIVKKKYQPDTKEYKYLQMLKPNDIIPYKKMTSKVTIKGLKQHYTEARLVQLLEEKGIGRPSTFSSLVEKIQERNYVKKEDIKGKTIVCKEYELVDGEIFEEDVSREFGNEKTKLVIQPLGIIVLEFLDKHFLSLFNYDYTKELEDDLDKISKGEKDWTSICDNCNSQLDKLIQGLKDETKMEIQIDDTHTYMIGKYGPVIKQVENINGKEEITFKPIKKDIDIQQIKEGELTVDEMIDTTVKRKQIILGKHDGQDVILHKGKYGLYMTWGENSKQLKDLGNRPVENVTFDEIKQYLEEGSNFIREISASLSIRKSAKGEYLFYKNAKMKKPQFFPLTTFYKETKEDYKTCDLSILKTWIKNTHQIC
jgi:DNA topoisomerase-1